MSPQRILDKLDELDVEYYNFEHEPVFSVGEAEVTKEMIGGSHTRNLFLRDKKKTMFLVTALDNTPIDLKKLSSVLGVGRFSFGSPERLDEMLGVKPGSVTPFAIINDPEQKVQMVLDKEMMEAEWVNYHPLINTMSTKLKPKDLLRYIDSCGHSPIILDMSQVAPDEREKQC